MRPLPTDIEVGAENFEALHPLQANIVDPTSDGSS